MLTSEFDTNIKGGLPVRLVIKYDKLLSRNEIMETSLHWIKKNGKTGAELPTSITNELSDSDKYAISILLEDFDN